MSLHLGRSGLAAAGSLLLCAVLLGACSGGEGEEPAGSPPVALPEDLCADVAPVVPSDLGLGDPTATLDEREGSVTATCSMSGSDGARLGVELTSYALADADDPREVRIAHLSACNELLSRDGLLETRQEELDCDATLPDGSFTSLDQVLARQAVLRIELSLPGRTSEQTAFYGTALGGDLRP